MSMGIDFHKRKFNIKKEWSNYFNYSQCSVRDERIFFNFTENELVRGGASRLLEAYGGEQISMPFKRGGPLGMKLKSIGEPMIVRCSLDPNKINTFIENPWGKTIFSSFHALMNPNAYRIDPDGYQLISVRPEDVIEIKIIS